MYIISVVAFLIVLVWMLFLCGSPIYFLDMPSLIIIISITVFMLMASGLFKDLKRAFVIIAKRNNIFSKLELQRSLEAVQLTMRLLWYSSIFEVIVGVISVLTLLDDPKLIAPNSAVILIAVFYALFGCMIFLPIQSKLKVLILSHSEE